MTINRVCRILNEDAKKRLDTIAKEQELVGALIEAAELLNDLERIQSLPSCNTCKRQGCEYMPKLGQYERFNCPLHKASAV